MTKPCCKTYPRTTNHREYLRKDQITERELAVKKYQTVLAESDSTPLAEQARKHIKQAYRE